MYKQPVFEFNNKFFNELPNHYEKVKATPLTQSKLITFSSQAAKLLNLPKGFQHTDDFLNVFSGQVIPAQGHHIAQVYSGHQFGHWAGQLGDGRSIFIGEVNGYDIHLKGAGQTPYSRMGDGRAVLRSTIREFLASEAMAALDIPTTRALCIVGSAQAVYREQVETGAVMTRLAQSHIRFGNFEHWFYLNKQDELNALADFCIRHHYPDCQSAKHPKLALLEQIINATAIMIAKWQAVGFCHGVMNTDNMSILGHTLDYGPFAFIDDYEPEFVCNHSDHTGRYAFDQQPGIGLWNLNALAYTFSGWLEKEQIETALSRYEPTLVRTYLALMQSKFGLAQHNYDDRPLLSEFLRLLRNDKVDYTLAFRYLNQIRIDDHNNHHCPQFLALFSNTNDIFEWLKLYRGRLRKETLTDQQRWQQMNQSNPLYVLRNYLAQQAIEHAEAGDYSELNTLLSVLETPYTQRPEDQRFAEPPPQWGKHMEISCSS
ncbi:YdiU family protein [Thalassotalea aquiviva]|uniref:protein adenylyltransferase SelO n=1 Tax=Thalassotalea aquiviva TaxID=3242415 RepID=UPI00352A13DA